MTSNLQKNNDQLINNIKTLQSNEMKLYDSLESKALNADQKMQIINQILYLMKKVPAHKQNTHKYPSLYAY